MTAFQCLNESNQVKVVAALQYYQLEGYFSPIPLCSTKLTYLPKLTMVTDCFAIVRANSFFYTDDGIK